MTRTSAASSLLGFVVTFLLIPAAVTTASAQGILVQATYGLDIVRFSAAEGDAVFDRARPALAASVAGFVAPHVTAGLEIDAGRTSTVDRTVSLSIAGRPATVTTSYTIRRRTVSALVGVHTRPDARVVFGAYGGLAFSSVRREIASNAPPIVLATPPAPSVFTDRTADPIAGADVAVRLTSAVAVVAAVRAQELALTGDLRGFSIRSGAGVRLTLPPH